MWGSHTQHQQLPLRTSGMPHPSGMPLKRNKDVVRETTYKVVAPKGSTTSPGAPGNQHHDERYVRHAPRRTAAPKGQEHARQHHEREGTTNERSSPTGHQADLNETWMSRDAFIRQADDEAPRPYMRFVNSYGTLLAPQNGRLPHSVGAVPEHDDGAERRCVRPSNRQGPPP